MIGLTFHSHIAEMVAVSFKEPEFTARVNPPDACILAVEEIVRESLTIAGEICIYTNTNLIVEKVGE